MKIVRNWVNLLGGFAALLGFFLPFDGPRSLFVILENTPLPFFSPSLVLLTAAALVLRDRRPRAAQLLSLGLLLGWLFLLALLLWVFSPAVLGRVGPGSFLLPLGLLAMIFLPYGA